MSKPEAQAWVWGWDAVADREREELRNQSPEEKLRALAFLMSSTRLFDMSSLEAEDEVARARWARLRSMMRDR